MKSLLTINEFSKLSGLEITTLRYWDDIGLFSPSTRNPDNNYRYYSPEQIIAVKFIYVMSNIGVPLKELAVLKNKQDPQNVYKLLSKQSRRLNEELRKLQESLSVINERQEFIRSGMDALDQVEGISVFHRDTFSYVLGPKNDWDEGKSFLDPFINFINSTNAARVNLNFPVGGMHENWESFLQSPGEPDYFFSVDPNGNSRTKSSNYLQGFSLGNYGEFGDLSERMNKYVEDKSIRITGPVYTIYLLDEICYNDPNQFLSQTFVAVKG